MLCAFHGRCSLCLDFGGMHILVVQARDILQPRETHIQPGFNRALNVASFE
jgi:hypothetical protein